MSSYRSSRAALRAAAGARACSVLLVEPDALEAIATAQEFLNSAAFAVHADALGAMSQADDLLAMLPASERMGTLATSALDEARRLLREAQAVPPAQATELVRDAADAAREAMAVAEQRIGRAGRVVMTEALLDYATGDDAGYDSVSMCTGETVTALEMRRGDSVVLVQVDDAGEVLREHIGTVGGGCRVDDDEIVAALAERGIDLTITEQDDHDGRRDGERLIRRAARFDADELTRGAILAASSTTGPLGAGTKTIWTADRSRSAVRRRATGGAA